MRAPWFLALLALALVAACGRPIDASSPDCADLAGTYTAHAEMLSGTCGVLGDGTGPLLSFEDSCAGTRIFPSGGGGQVTWTSDATYSADGATGEAQVTLERTGVNPCAGEYRVTFSRL